MIDGISVSAAKNPAAPVSMPPVTQMIVTAETMHAKANAATARNSVVFQVGWINIQHGGIFYHRRYAGAIVVGTQQLHRLEITTGAMGFQPVSDRVRSLGR